MKNRIAIIFPGIGYHTDKPLLYFGKKQAAEMGYKIIEVNYEGFPENIRGDQNKMFEAYKMGFEQAKEILAEHDIHKDDEVLILSKSIGTVIAAAWQKEAGIRGKNIYFTPVENSFDIIEDSSGIVFHGTNDLWVESKIVEEQCEKLHLPLYTYAQANHSLETGDTVTDLLNITTILTKISSYILDLM